MDIIGIYEYFTIYVKKKTCSNTITWSISIDENNNNV